MLVPRRVTADEPPLPAVAVLTVSNTSDSKTRLAIAQRIFSHFTHCVSEVEVVEEAASTGQLEIFKFLLEKDGGHTQEEYEAGTSGHRFVGEGNSVTWGGKDMQLAA